MRGVLYRTEKDGTTLAVPELRISASNSRTVYYENNAAKQSALNNNEIREGSIVLTGLAGNNEDYATKAYVDSKIGNLEHQVGVIVGFPGNVPNGYLLCDGNRFDKNKYPELYEYLGTDVLPDYRECVLVGAGQNTTNSIATHDVYTVGQFKDDQVQEHTHYVDLAYSNWGGKSGNTNRIDSSQTSDISYTNKTPLKGISGARAGTVTHGKQKGLNWAIKAAPITISSSPIQYQEDDLLKLKQQPDWENAIQITASQLSTGYEAPSDGMIVGAAYIDSPTGFKSFFVNSVIVGKLWRASGNDYDMLDVQCQVNKGDIIRSESLLNGGCAISFIPFKTVAVKLSSSTPTESISLEDSYSTTETKTNKIWIDGRTIYRQCITVNTTSSTASATEATINASTTYPYIDQIISATQIDSANKRIINSNGARMVNSKILVYSGAYGIGVGHILILEYVK